MPIKVKDETQARAYTFVNPEDNFRIDDQFYWRLGDKAKAYRRANNYPIGSAWENDFEQNVCRHSPDTCRETEMPPPAARAGAVIRAAARWAASGFKTRSTEEAEAILENYCRKCEYYAGEKGLLRIACSKCGCSNKKVYLATEHCPLPEPKW